MRAEGARGSRRHARASRGARSHSGRRARRASSPAGTASIPTSGSAPCRRRAADVPVRQPAGESRRILRRAAPPAWLPHRARRAAATPLARSTSWISPTSAPFATRFGPSSPARWTTSRSSTRRSRSSSFPAPPVFRRIRCPPRGGSPGPDADGSETDAARARRALAIGRRRGRSGSGRAAVRSPRSSRRRWARRGGDRRAIELQPARRRRVRRARVAARRARVARCRAIVRSPAAPRPVAPLAAGDPGTTLRPSTHAARRPADRRRGAVAALAAPPAAGAAIRAAGRRQPLDERLRTDRAADGGRDGGRHDADRGVHVLDGAPARDRRGAAGGGGGARHLDRLHHAWAGGTSIGACLRDFLRRFGDRMVGRDTVVMITSDGLDVGAPDMLRDAMRELHRRSAGVVWLNPLLETEGYGGTQPTLFGVLLGCPRNRPGHSTHGASEARSRDLPASLARMHPTCDRYGETSNPTVSERQPFPPFPGECRSECHGKVPAA